MTDWWACCGAHCDIAHCPQWWQTGGHVAERTVLSHTVLSDDRLVGMLRSALWYRTLSSVMTDWACCGAHCDIAHCPHWWQTRHVLWHQLSSFLTCDNRLDMFSDISCPHSSSVMTDQACSVTLTVLVSLLLWQTRHVHWCEDRPLTCQVKRLLPFS